MLIKHSLSYLLARGVPGIVSFLILIVFTRLLTPQEFGLYALVLATAGLLNILFFQWIRMVATRYFSENVGCEVKFISELYSIYVAIAFIVLIALGLSAYIINSAEWRLLAILVAPLILVQALFELNLEFYRADLNPIKYGVSQGIKSFLTLVLSVLFLVFIDATGVYAVLGVVAAFFITVVYQLFISYSCSLRLENIPIQRLKEYVLYGLPLTMSLALSWIVTSSDRLLIKWYLDSESVGLYSVSYDLAQQSLTLLLVIINTAAMPLAIKAMSEQGRLKGLRQLQLNGELIITIALIAAGYLIINAEDVALIFIGENYRATVLTLMPWVVIASATSGVKSFYLDTIFFLEKKSYLLLIAGGIAAVINVLLNILLIPSYGLIGAVLATLIAFLVASVISYSVSYKCFGGIKIKRTILLSCMAAFPVIIFMYFINLYFFSPGWGRLVMNTIGGGAMTLLMIYGFDIGGVKEEIKKVKDRSK